MFRPICTITAAVLCLGLEGCSNEPSGAAAVRQQTSDVVPEGDLSVAQASSRGNANRAQDLSAIGIISGEDNSAHSRIIDDLATILDSNWFRFRRLSSQGPSRDLLSLLQRPEADIAIVQTDAIETLTGQAREAARERLRYLFRIPDSRLHILASRDVTDVHQLTGRKVNIDQLGSGTHLTARLIFDKLGIKPDFTSYDQAGAHQRLRSGGIQAAVQLASHASTEIRDFPSDGRFHLLSIPFEEVAASPEGLMAHYPPGRFTAEEYPQLIEPGQQVETIAVSRVLAIRNWPEGSGRYVRMTRLAEAIDARFDELRNLGGDPQWNEIDLPAEASGWQRFRPVQQMLERRARRTDERRALEEFAAGRAVCTVPDQAARERLYSDFMAWRGTRDKGASP